MSSKIIQVISLAFVSLLLMSLFLIPITLFLLPLHCLLIIHSSVFKDHMLLGVKANFTILLWQAAAAAKSLQLCPTLCNPIDGSPLGSPVPGFSRQEHWSGLPFPSPMCESEK